MAFLVAADQPSQMFCDIPHENYYPAFLNHITKKFRGIRKGTLGDYWERQFFDAIVAYPPGELPASILNEALVLWSKSDEFRPDQPLTGVITEASLASIQAAEQGVMNLLFRPVKPSKGTRRNAAKAAKKAVVGMAAAAVAFGEQNSIEFMVGEMAAALPEVRARQQQQQEEEEDDEDDEDDGDGPAPVSFENLAFR